jgi:CheY-like chemotaxis protein
MSRILLVDDSPHAQRMGERILSEEGYEVVTVSNADSALIRLDDVDPDVVLADAVMPGRNGYDICHYLKMSPRHRHVRVILTAGVLELLDEEQAKRVQADALLKKPFEASALLSAVKPLAEAAATARAQAPNQEAAGKAQAGKKSAPAAPFVAVVDGEQVRAAVTIALDAAMGVLVEEIATRVVSVLRAKKPEPRPLEDLVPAPSTTPAKAEAVPAAPASALPSPAAPRVEPVRRVSPVRLRGSILGLNLPRPEPPESE